jgi:hypothetical protein
MREFLILLSMIFCHIVDDYYLQGILASMKQKGWWQKQESYCDKYKHDYIIALIMHAFSWAFMISIPLIIAGASQIVIGIAIVINSTIHAIVDDLKANKQKINLVADQSIHLLQILITWVIAGVLGF